MNEMTCYGSDPRTKKAFVAVAPTQHLQLGRKKMKKKHDDSRCEV
jgi:hypothetical protein